MKAIAIDDFAADPTMHDLPDPTPGAGEVLVRVEASSENGMDLAVAGGMVKGRMEYELPPTDVLGRLATAVVNGDLTVPIDRTYALRDVGQALQDFTAGKRGKLAITVR